MTSTVVISARCHPRLRSDLDRRARVLGITRNDALVQAVQDWVDDPRNAERAADADLADEQDTIACLRADLR